MKINKAVIETVINYIHLAFEKDQNLGDFENLLIGSEISEEESPSFLCKDKIDYVKLEKRMTSNNDFFLSLVSNLLPYLLNNQQRGMFQQIMKRFGYILGVNKRFRKGTRAELQDHSSSKTIKKLEIYKDASRRRFRVAVNDKLIPWISPHGNTNKHYWDYLYEIAESKESEIIDIGKADGIEQWFNSKKENPIYKYTGLEFTKIIERSGEFFFPAPGVIIKELSQNKAYSNTVS